MQKISEANRDRGGIKLPMTFSTEILPPSWSRKFARQFAHPFLGAAMLIALAACLSPRARAGDLEDCNSSAADKIEAGCTTIINKSERTPEDGLKALTNRARLYANRSKFDPALETG